MNSSKTQYEVTLSQEAWAGVETIAQNYNLSVSELLEKVGFGKLAIVNSEDVEDLEDYLNLQEPLLVEAELKTQEPILEESLK
jgi:hypothetical protein